MLSKFPMIEESNYLTYIFQSICIYHEDISSYCYISLLLLEIENYHLSRFIIVNYYSNYYCKLDKYILQIYFSNNFLLTQICTSFLIENNSKTFAKTFMNFVRKSIGHNNIIRIYVVKISFKKFRC